MSLESTNYLTSDCNIDNLYWVIEKLGYEEIKEESPCEGCIRNYQWKHPDNELTYVGIELSVSKKDARYFMIHTRSRMGRSFRELEQQNNTIKTIQNFFGGTFDTSCGDGKYLDSNECNPEKTEVAMALYIQRWRLNNAFVPIKIYSDFINRAFHHSAPAGDIYGTKLGIIPLVDCLRPCVVSANVLLPYIIGAWENYVKNSYLSILKYADVGNKIIKPDKLTAEDLERIRKGETTVEECIVSKFSFQKPKRIIDNFKNLDNKLKISHVFNKPYENLSPGMLIEEAVRLRNQIVHEGSIDIKLTHEYILNLLNNIDVIADRLYEEFAKKYGFDANYSFK